MMQKKRMPEPDIAKILCLSCVILQHSGRITGRIFNFLIMFDIPLFFLLSGFVSAQSKKTVPFSEYLKTKSKRLLLPYFLFYFFDVLLYAIMQCIRKAPFDLLTIRHNLILLFTLFGVSVVWFLSALYLADISFHFMITRKKTGKILTIVFYVLLFLIALIVRTPFETWYVQIYATNNGIVPVLPDAAYYLSGTILRLPMCTFLYAAGYYFNTIFTKEKVQTILHRIHQKNRFLQISLFSLFSVALYTISYFVSVCNEVGNLAVYHYGKNFFLYLIAAFTGTAATLLLSHVIVLINCKPVLSILSYYGKNTLIILITHLDFFILTNAIRISDRISFLPSRNLCRLPLILFLTLLFEIPIIEIINRFFPVLIGKTKKR